MNAEMYSRTTIQLFYFYSTFSGERGTYAAAAVLTSSRYAFSY